MGFRLASSPARHLILAAFLLVSSLGLVAFGAGDGGCTNKQATDVPVQITESGASERCGIGIKLFGYGGGLFGEKCPEFEILVPAHQKCTGEDNPGTDCAPEQDLPVQTRECSCVEDFQTVPCRD